jgi:hypothetical protein
MIMPPVTARLIGLIKSVVSDCNISSLIASGVWPLELGFAAFELLGRLRRLSFICD